MSGSALVLELQRQHEASYRAPLAACKSLESPNHCCVRELQQGWALPRHRLPASPLGCHPPPPAATPCTLCRWPAWRPTSPRCSCGLGARCSITACGTPSAFALTGHAPATVAAAWAAQGQRHLPAARVRALLLHPPSYKAADQQVTPLSLSALPSRKSASPHAHTEPGGADAEGKPLLPLNGDVEATSGGGGAAAELAPPGDLGKPSYAWTSSAFYRCLTLDSEALLACREALRSAVEVRWTRASALRCRLRACCSMVVAAPIQPGRCCWGWCAP